MQELSTEHLRRLRLRAQHLAPRAGPGGLHTVVRDLCGVNAQSSPAMALALRARIAGFEPTSLDRAMRQGRLVRGWAMRGTLHLLDPNDLAWLLAIVGPPFIARDGRRRAQLGLDDARTERGARAIAEVLGGRGCTPRAELVETLVDRGVLRDARGQAPIHLIMYAALQGLVHRGPDLPDGDQTFCPSGGRRHGVDGHGSAGRKALGGLALRYVRGYGPASVRDFASWTGLPSALARDGWDVMQGRGGGVKVAFQGRALTMLAGRRAAAGGPGRRGAPAVSLLPAFDPLVLAYADRDAVVPRAHRKEVFHGGQTVPVVLVDGIAAGTWRYERRGRGLVVSVAPFGALDGAVLGRVEAEALDVGRVLGARATEVRLA